MTNIAQGASAPIIAFPNSPAVVENSPRRGRLPRGVVSLATARKEREKPADDAKYRAAVQLWSDMLELAEQRAHAAIAEEFRAMRDACHD